MATTHGKAAEAEMDRMERESGEATPTKTFKDARAALANAKQLLAKGEITKAEFTRLSAKLGRKAQSEDLNDYMDDSYSAGKR